MHSGSEQFDGFESPIDNNTGQNTTALSLNLLESTSYAPPGTSRVSVNPRRKPTWNQNQKLIRRNASSNLGDSSNVASDRTAKLHCWLCSDLKFDPSLHERADFPSHMLLRPVSSDSLAETAAGGCSICNILKAGVEDMLRRKSGLAIITDFKYFLTPRRARSPSARGLEARLDYSVRSGNSNWLQLETMFYSDSDAPTPWNQFTRPNDVQTKLEIEKCRSFAGKLLDECSQNHPKCQRPRTGVFPRHIVDLEHEGCESRVALVAYHQNSKDYAALSHCWGDGQPLNTTKATLTKRRGGIDWTDLPKNFQDAILATRSLRLRYIWIDSLCIVQDDKADWAKESVKMASIYSAATLVLAGSAASNPSQGLLYERRILPNVSHEENVDTELRHETDEENEFSVFVKFAPDHPRYFHVGDHPSGSLENAPLMKRAWAFQERKLATRILHFLSAELVWECKTMLVCECESLVHRKGVDMFADEILSVEVAQRQWLQLVNTYSNLAITKQSDRLPALSGFSTYFQQHFPGSRYLAGLWEHDLLRSLLWKLDGLPRGNFSAKKPRPPSWSWASFDTTGVGELYSSFLFGPPEGSLRSFKNDPRTRVISADTTTVGASPYGEVESGHIILEGPAVLAYRNMTIADDRNYNNHSLTRIDKSYNVNGSARWWPVKWWPEVYHTCLDESNPARRIELNEAEDKAVICLLIGCLSGDEGGADTYGLVLKDVSDKDSDNDMLVCERIGMISNYVQVDKYWWDDPVIKRLKLI